MKKLLITSFILGILSISAFLLIPSQPASAVPFAFNQSAITIPWTVTSRSSSTYDVFMDPGNNNTVTSWYRGTSGSSTVTLMLGSTVTTPTFHTCTATGGNITSSGGREIHTFQTNGTFTLTSATCHAQILVIGPGGKGGALVPNNGGGGGGAGGVLYNSSYTLTSQSYTVTVGTIENHTSIFDIMTANAGGRGGDGTHAGSNGGSGGGSGGLNAAGSPTQTSLHGIGYGHGGGIGSGNFGGGGGGAGSSGGAGTGASNNGTGVSFNISGANVTYAAGGKGGVFPNNAGASGTPHTGNGGNGAGAGSGVYGGSGIIIISLPNNETSNLTIQPTTISLPCTPSNTVETQMISNSSNLYFVCSTTLRHFNILTDITVRDFSTDNAGTVATPFWTRNAVVLWGSGGATSTLTSIANGNVSIGASSNFPNVYSNENIGFSTPVKGLRANFNTTTAGAYINSEGYINYAPTNLTKNIDKIAFDPAFSAKTLRYWHGLGIKNVANYYTNSSLPFYTSIESNTYKDILTLPDQILGITDGPSTEFILHTNTINYMVVVTANNIYYYNADLIKAMLTGNHAKQSYIIADPHGSSLMEIPNPVSQSFTVFGPNINSTGNIYGFVTLPSPYTMRLANTGVRTIDPQWTDSSTSVYPALYSTSSLFPIFLTVSNAPTDSAIIASYSSIANNGVSSVWAVTRLDATRSAEIDVPAGICFDVFIGDNSVTPVVYIYQGNICATGTNTKTIAYTNTLPISFYTFAYGAASSYTPSNNALAVTTRSATTPFTYNVIIKNSTGSITQNFTKTSSVSLDTHTFNVTNASKPASLYVTIPGYGQIYSSYLGSPLSFASTVSFFHQYFSYQGFDFLSFIPLIFAAMFTRNTVGIGTALTVVCIATLSFLSIVVIPDTVIYISIIVAAIGMIGYRSLYG